MTAVVSSGASPLSALDEDDEMQSWQFLESSGGIDAGSYQSAGRGSFEDGGASDMLFTSGAVAASPSMLSQGSWNIINFSGQQQYHPQHQRLSSFTTPSPVLSHHMSDLRTASYSTAATFGPVSTADVTGGHGAMMFNFANTPMELPPQTSQQDPFLDHTIMEGQGEATLLTQNPYNPQSIVFDDFNLGFDPVPMLPEPILESFDNQSDFRTSSLPGIPMSMQQDLTNVQPWDPTSMQNPGFDSEHLTTPGSNRSSISLSPQTSAIFPAVRNYGELEEVYAVVHDIPKKLSGVQKSKKKNKTPPRVKSPDRKLEDGIFKFCNQTVDTFGKTAFGEMEHLDRSSQKGRKGALSNEVRASALNVRKQGACFCCHVRKVKCDEQRPCKNCVRLCNQVPEAACWKFSEFTTILFPAFVRRHFEKVEMSRFVEDNVASFTINGVDTPCTVTLSSGHLFATKLTVKAKFFTPKSPTSEVLQHWYSKIGEHGVELEPIRSAPLGLDIVDNDIGGSLRTELKRKVMAYMEGLVGEEKYAEQLNDLIRDTTMVPRLVLQLVHRYAQQAPETDAAIVRRMLGILVLQHALTRHLTLTPQSITEVQRVHPLRLTVPFMTSRLLARQIKVVMDECIRELVPLLFDDFLKRLKSKSRKEWAPCVAAFLVFCILMEITEAAVDNFAIAENEIGIRNGKPAKFMRARALEVNRQIENMPFKQFAYQFHQIYQTHSQDVSAKSFNPLHDNARSDTWDLEPAAMELVRGLREGIDGKFSSTARTWREISSLQCIVGELDWLTFEPILPANSEDEAHPYPRDVAGPYYGRLVAKFLLSFNDVGYLFTGS